MEHRFNVTIQPQPTESTCGPTCLNALYQHLGLNQSLEQTIAQIPELEEGGTLGVSLGIHALDQGFKVRIFTHNLRVFDPTWFSLEAKEVIAKLKAQAKIIHKPSKVRMSSKLYQQFIENGGQVSLETLSPAFLLKLLQQGSPLITGLSSTYLYRSKREYGLNCIEDDLQGVPQGHFVVIDGMLADQSRTWICDPFGQVAKGQVYLVDTIELINSILVGVITYDANIIQILPRGSAHG